MKTFDTNIVVRIVVKDDEAQERQAKRIWRDALAGGGVFLPKVVVVETVWVLRSAYRFEANTIAETLQNLLDIEGLTVEDEDQVRRSLALFERGNADLADYLILESGRSAQALPVKTFDRRFAREDDVELAK